jgi:hypothetical protein
VVIESEWQPKQASLLVATIAGRFSKMCTHHSHTGIASGNGTTYLSSHLR